jgi:hypothetical protein
MEAAHFSRLVDFYWIIWHYTPGNGVFHKVLLYKVGYVIPCIGRLTQDKCSMSEYQKFYYVIRNILFNSWFSNCTLWNCIPVTFLNYLALNEYTWWYFHNTYSLSPLFHWVPVSNIFWCTTIFSILDTHVHICCIQYHCFFFFTVSTQFYGKTNGNITVKSKLVSLFCSIDHNPVILGVQSAGWLDIHFIFSTSCKRATPLAE